jgi:hypothetical protein
VRGLHSNTRLTLWWSFLLAFYPSRPSSRFDRHACSWQLSFFLALLSPWTQLRWGRRWPLALFLRFIILSLLVLLAPPHTRAWKELSLFLWRWMCCSSIWPLATPLPIYPSPGLQGSFLLVIILVCFLFPRLRLNEIGKLKRTLLWPPFGGKNIWIYGNQIACHCQ